MTKTNELIKLEILILELIASLGELILNLK